MKNFQELCDRCSGKFIARSTDDFVGDGVTDHGSGARAVARHLERIVHHSRASNLSAIKILMNGAPGTGKTALALYLQSLLGCGKWSITKLNGTQLKIELIEELSASLHYKGLFGDYRLIHIDEADEIPRIAQVRFLSMLDDLPDGVAVVCTSNCKLRDFENRFQTRFQVFEIMPPNKLEIEALLSHFVAPAVAQSIANFAGGNVRQALLDAKGALQQTMPMLTAATA